VAGAPASISAKNGSHTGLRLESFIGTLTLFATAAWKAATESAAVTTAKNSARRFEALMLAAVAAARFKPHAPRELGQYHQATVPAELDRNVGRVPLPTGNGAHRNPVLLAAKSSDWGVTPTSLVPAAATPATHAMSTGKRCFIALPMAQGALA